MNTKEIHKNLNEEELTKVMKNHGFELGLVDCFDPKSKNSYDLYFVSQNPDVIIKCEMFRNELVQGVCSFVVDDNIPKEEMVVAHESCFFMIGKKSNRASCYLNDYTFDFFETLSKNNNFAKFEDGLYPSFPLNYIENAIVTANPEIISKKDLMFLKLNLCNEKMKSVAGFQEDSNRKKRIELAIKEINEQINVLQ